MSVSRFNTAAVLLASFLTSTLGCASPNQAGTSSHTPPSASDPSPHMLDGTFSDWTAPNQAQADGRYIYLRFSPGAEHLNTIQAAPYTTRIRFDSDQTPQTGRPMQTMRLDASMQQPQGVDLLIELSPKNELGTIGIGSAVTLYESDGSAITSNHADVGFAFLPTYASPSFEARIDRLAPGSESLQFPGLVDIVIDQVDENDRYVWSTAMTLDLPPLDKPADSYTAIPTKPDHSVRVMSSNVLFASPLHDPAPFDRILDAIEPDIILYQEWFKTDIPSVKAWIKQYAGNDWTIHIPSTKAGVAIATKLPIIKSYDAVIPAASTDRPSRAAAALIQSDAGEILAISIHLKCCGGAGSPEDLKRIAQAKAINQFIREVRQNHPEAAVVIAGDFNLVGSRDPLEIMGTNLAHHHQNLTPVECTQLNDQSTITWMDEKSRFSPGRLDWMLIDESRTAVEHAFILNTRVLSDESLHDAGLENDDSKASDHLPVVIDLTRVP